MTVAALVELVADVQRVLHTSEPTQVQVPPVLTAEGAQRDVSVGREAAERVEPELAALRRLLVDKSADRRTLGAPNRGNSATVALRNLLEIVLDTQLRLDRDGSKRERTQKDDLDAALEAAAAAVEPGDEEPRTWAVRNLTADDLTLNACGGVDWIVPAFGLRTTERNPRQEFKLQVLEARGAIEVIDPPTPKTPPSPAILALYVYLLPLAIGAFVFLDGIWVWVLIACALVVPAAAYFLRKWARGQSDRLWGVARGLPAWSLQAVTFLIVLTFCLAVPAVTLYYGANLEPVVSAVADGRGTQADYLTLVCRSMQLVLIAIVSLLPALLYYQFDRDRMSTLREKFVQQIFRLDSRLKTTGAIYAKYGPTIDEIYGAERAGRYRKLPPGRRAPIFVATVLIMIGWLLVLLNPDVGVMRPEGSVTAEEKIAQLFEPRHTAPAFAFLGAYFFTLFALLRGYVRRDLRPKSYSDISVRIVAVVILAWVLELMWGGGANDTSSGLLVLAFLVGIVPQAALNGLRELWQRRLPGLPVRRPGTAQVSPGESSDDTGDDQTSRSAGRADNDVDAALADRLPLTNLEGIDLYDRTRLGSEGVTNIEALAHHDLIDLMLMTRIPVPRLVDWTDQAILHLHVTTNDLATLRRYGIRTASDLEYAASKATDKDKFHGILDGDSAAGPSRLELILGAIEDEEWMENIRSWHGHDRRSPETAEPNGSPKASAASQAVSGSNP